MEWEMKEDDYDYHLEIARSGYSDMLHDTERNKKFDEGLRKAIALVHSRGQRSHVLDIGTGTGLLSMLAVRSGAHEVTACEAFKPMSDCAMKVIADNGMSDRIRLINKRSNDMTAAKDGDMMERANILVTEVLDTELIGEGALHTYNHAHRNLLTNDCVVVPRAANVYVQLVQSEYLSHYNTVTPVSLDCGSRVVSIPAEVNQCGGAPSLYDLQLNQVPRRKFTLVSDPRRVFRFDFTGRTELPFDDTSVSDVTIIHSGRVDAIFVWWDIEVDPEGDVILSCAPSWAHPDLSQMQWRDHWMQAIYFPPQPISVTEGTNVKVVSHHDDYSLWFDVTDDKSGVITPLERPICTCGLHVASSRQRLAMLNDGYRRGVFVDALKKIVTKDTVCLVISDGGLLPCVAARLGAAKVYVIETNEMCRRLSRNCAEVNGLEETVKVLETEVDTLDSHKFDGNKIDVVIMEPYVVSSDLPWHNFHCWGTLSQLTNHLSPSAVVLPGHVTVKAIGVQFDNLWKINSPVIECEGLKMRSFDKLIEKSSQHTDSYMEVQPLWEYPCVALTRPVVLARFDWSIPVYMYDDSTSVTNVDFERNGSCNGVVVWIEYKMADSGTISSGAVGECVPGEYVEWDTCTNQGVHILRYPHDVTVGSSVLECHTMFAVDNTDLDFGFEIRSEQT